MDFILDAAKQQGYVPQGCTLFGNVVMFLIHRAEDPCRGCHADRTVCKGRYPEQDYVSTSVDAAEDS